MRTATRRFFPRFNPHGIPECVQAFAQWGGYLHPDPVAWNVNDERPVHPWALGQDPQTWAPFELAVARRRALGLDGISFLPDPAFSPFLFVTLHDAASQRRNNRPNRAAARAVTALDTYVEVAPNRDDLTAVLAAEPSVVLGLDWTGNLLPGDLPTTTRHALSHFDGDVTVWPLAFAVPLTGDIVQDPGVRDLGTF